MCLNACRPLALCLFLSWNLLTKVQATDTWVLGAKFLLLWCEVCDFMRVFIKIPDGKRRSRSFRSTAEILFIIYDRKSQAWTDGITRRIVCKNRMFCHYLFFFSESYQTSKNTQSMPKHAAARPIRNPNVYHTGRTSMKSYERELRSSFWVNLSHQVSVIIPFLLPRG